MSDADADADARASASANARASAQPLCPLCGGPNACVPAACGHFGAPCWCRDVMLPPALHARVPQAARGVACVCAACATATVVCPVAAS